MLGKTKVEIAKKLGTILYITKNDKVESEVYDVADIIGGLEMIKFVELYYDGLVKRGEQQ